MKITTSVNIDAPHQLFYSILLPDEEQLLQVLIGYTPIQPRIRATITKGLRCGISNGVLPVNVQDNLGNTQKTS